MPAATDDSAAKVTKEAKSKKKTAKKLEIKMKDPKTKEAKPQAAEVRFDDTDASVRAREISPSDARCSHTAPTERAGGPTSRCGCSPGGGCP